MDTARAMSQENVEVIREWWSAWNGDPADLGDTSWVDVEVVYVDDILPDHVGETYHGLEGIRKAWTLALEPWENPEYELEWVRDAGDEVVSCHRGRGRGKESGIDVEFRFAYVWRFREGKLVHLKSYGDVREALEAAGLRE
jgi:ketosteroid isomerase-like protein